MSTTSMTTVTKAKATFYDHYTDQHVFAGMLTFKTSSATAEELCDVLS